MLASPPTTSASFVRPSRISPISARMWPHSLPKIQSFTSAASSISPRSICATPMLSISLCNTFSSPTTSFPANSPPSAFPPLSKRRFFSLSNHVLDCMSMQTPLYLLTKFCISRFRHPLLRSKYANPPLLSRPALLLFQTKFLLSKSSAIFSSSFLLSPSCISFSP